MAIRPSFFLICAAVRLLQGYRRCNHIRSAVGVAHGGGEGVAAGAQLRKDSVLGAAVEGPADCVNASACPGQLEIEPVAGLVGWIEFDEWGINVWKGAESLALILIVRPDFLPLSVAVLELDNDNIAEFKSCVAD